MSESAILDFSSMGTPDLGAVPETPETPTPETPESAVPDAPETPESATPDNQPEAEQKPPSLKELREAIKSISEANPQYAKQLKSMLDNEGRIRAYQELYPDVDSARSIKAAIDAAGGVEGIAKLSDLQSFVDDVNAKWDEGDPSALDTVFEDGGEGPVKLLPHYMNRVEKANPEAFLNAIKPHLVRSLQAANFEPVLASLAKLVADKPEAKDVVDSMIEWFNGQKRQSERSNMDSLEPERAKLSEREKGIVDRENRQFDNELGQHVKPHMDQEFAKGMRSYLENNTQLNDRVKQDIASAWLKELGAALEKDQKQIMSLSRAKNRNSGSVANFVKTRISAVAPSVTQKIVDAYKLTPGKAGAKPPEKKAAAAQPTGQPNVYRVKERPADGDIDWDADPDRLHFISGKAKLRGKNYWVKWR